MNVTWTHLYVEMVCALISLDHIHVTVQMAIDLIIKLALVSLFLLTEKKLLFTFLFSIDIDECTEPDTDGSFPSRCNNSEVCINTIGSYTCVCSPIFNTTGTCVCTYTWTFSIWINSINKYSCYLDNQSLCNFINNDTCVGNNGTVLCLHSTIDVNSSCIRK
jgi:hypothetical protein